MTDPSALLLKESRWFRTVEGTHYYLPSMSRGFSIVELRSLAIPRTMNWDLTPTQDGVTCGVFTGSTAGYGVESSCKRVTGLRPGLVSAEPPVGESTAVAETFRHRFFRVGGSFPPKDFRAPGWVYSAPGSDTWWSKITDYVLAENADLKGTELYVAIEATRHGLRINASQFHSILELYCAESGTFFTPNGELGITPFEMHDVSGLPLGDFPYEEYVPDQDEINQLSDHSPLAVETLWELLCHFHICLSTLGASDHKGKKKKTPGISHKNWADYLFPGNDVKGTPAFPLGACDEPEVEARIAKEGSTVILDRDEGGFKSGTVLHSFHHQAKFLISGKALLAGYLMLWLKRCVIPTHSFEALPVEVVYPAVCLAHGKSYSLVSATIACIHRGLRTLTSQFCRVSVLDEGDGEVIRTPNPRVGLPYTYLMAWFVYHCECLMSAPAALQGDKFVPFVQRLERCSWKCKDIPDTRKTLSHFGHYNFRRSFPYFSGGGYGESLRDAPTADHHTVLTRGAFRWLVDIRPGYHVLRIGSTCYLEPYIPCRFARQFGYDQLYVGNANPRLHFEGGLVDGARGWFWTYAGGTQARFELPAKDRDLHHTLLYCRWYRGASADPANFWFQSSCLAERDRPIRGSLRSSKRRGHQTARELFSEDPVEDCESFDAGGESEVPDVQAPVQSPTIGQMGAPLLSPSSSLLSKRQREAVAESSRAEAAKKARCDGTVGTIQAAGGRDDVSPIRIPGVALSGSGVAPSGSGVVSPASPAASGAVQETPKDVPLPSDVGSPSGVPTASLPASRGSLCNSTLDCNVALAPFDIGNGSMQVRLRK